MEGRVKDQAKSDNQNGQIESSDKSAEVNPAAQTSTVHEALMLSSWLSNDANFKSIDKNHNGFLSNKELQSTLDKLKADGQTRSIAYKSTNYALTHIDILENEHKDEWVVENNGISKPDTADHLAKQTKGAASSTQQLNQEFHRASTLREFIQHNIKNIDSDHNSYVTPMELHNYIKSSDPDGSDNKMATFVQDKYDDIYGLRVTCDNFQMHTYQKNLRSQDGLQLVDFQIMEDALNPPLSKSEMDIDKSRSSLPGSIAIGTIGTLMTAPFVAGGIAIGGLSGGPPGAVIGAGTAGAIPLAVTGYAIYDHRSSVAKIVDRASNARERIAHDIYSKPVPGIRW